MDTATPGGQVGPYRLDVQIGQTPNSEVWAARRDDQLDAVVALKLLRGAEAQAEAALREEARAAQSLTHPALVPIFDMGESENVPYVAMELVRGPSLARLLERLGERGGHVPPSIVAYIGVRVTEALGYAATHASVDGFRVKLFHRHLSPSNVLIDAGGQVRLSDFGLTSSNAIDDRGRALRGQAEYLSPEQIKGESIDERADLYAVGAILHHCATGRPPFVGPKAEQVLSAVLERTAPSLSKVEPAFPAKLAQVISRALQKDPAARFHDASEMRRALLDAASEIRGYHDAMADLAKLVEGSFPEGFVGSEQGSERRRRQGASSTGEFVPLKALEPKPPPHISQPPARRVIERQSSSTDGRPSSKPPSAAPEVGANGQAKSGTGSRIEVVSVRPVREEDRTTQPVPRPNSTPQGSARGDDRAGGASHAPPPPPRLSLPRSNPEAKSSAPPFGTAGLAGIPLGTPLPDPGGAPGRPASGRSMSPLPVPIVPRPKSGLEQLNRWGTGVLEDSEQRKTLLLAAAAVALGLVLWLGFSGPSSRHDEALRTAYEGQRYQEAEKYFLEHHGDFVYPESAFELAADARNRRLGLAVARSEAEAPAEAAPVPAPELAQPAPPAVEKPATKPLATIWVPDRIPMPPASKKPDKKARADARRFEDSGVRAAAAGRLDQAYQEYQRCLAAREHPSCHLRAALVLEQKGEAMEAARHFERYLMLYPEAPQAAEIRERIATARGQR